MAVDVATHATSPLNDPTRAGTWRERATQARAAQRPFIPIWLLNLAFAAGQHWVAWDKRAQRVRSLRELDPRYADRELVTVDRINEYRQVQLAELESDDDRPELLVVQEGEQSEEVAAQLNRAVAYAWDHEWGAEEALAKARRYSVDLGVSALRCRWDPNAGNVAGLVPHHPATGQPIAPDSNPQEWGALAATGQLTDGSLPVYREVLEGRTCWEAYSPFGILAPPGCNHEDSFPWEILVRPVSIEALAEEYGDKAASLQEDSDIASAMGLSTAQAIPDTRSQGTGLARLRGHVWLYTCFQRPTRSHPRGLEAVFASNQWTPMNIRDELAYKLPGGEYHSGVRYLHWWRLNDRFYSRAFIEPLKDPQRIINRRETQNTEIVDRTMPRTYVEKGSMPEAPTGAPMEIIELKPGSKPPQFSPGAGPGAWMYQDLAHQADNLGHASTIAAIRLGENPPSVDTYSQLALLNDNEASKRAVVIRDQRRQIGKLVEMGVSDIRKYWPAQKQILVSGPEDQLSQAMFEKSRIPDFYVAKVATGAPQPRSQGAELKMIDAVWAAAVQSWVAVQNGGAWVEWYQDSVKAGIMLDLPSSKDDTQRVLAYLENQQMLDGELPQVMDYDVLTTHLPIHREAEDQARAAGDQRTLALIVQHIDQHQKVAQANQANVARAAQGLPAVPVPGAPGSPGSAVPAGAVATNGVPPAQGFPSIGGYQVHPHEPQPQVIPGDFFKLAGGQ